VKNRAQSVTTLVDSPVADRKRRMIRYSVAMGIRMVCIVLMLFVKDWALIVCALGAIFLPYFAVILANVVAPARSKAVEGPGGLLLRADEPVG
jgi:hypothetical protein